MRILDAHVHVMSDAAPDGPALLARMKKAGVSGGVVMSLPPPTFRGDRKTPRQRIDQVLAITRGQPDLYPFFWIDAIAPDALRQADLAVKAGIRGFKVICDRHAPGDPRALRLFARIAALERPILFHSGILWDGKPSSDYNRPAGFEPLMMIPGLRFALAHVSWPWTDECLAVYGKIYHARRSAPARYGEMFIDTTPGTPPLFREDVLRKLWSLYPVENNVLFGLDNLAEDYHVEAARQWIRRDRALCRKLKVPAAATARYFSENLPRFITG